jgi:hypothetical protein
MRGVNNFKIEKADSSILHRKIGVVKRRCGAKNK